MVRTADGRDVKAGFDTMSASLYPPRLREQPLCISLFRDVDEQVDCASHRPSHRMGW